jgi:hypothetical protein
LLSLREDENMSMTPEEVAMLRQILSQGGSNAPAANLGASLYPSLGKKVGDTNYYQDRVQMLGDPFSGAMAGSGAYDETAFMPTMQRTSVEAPGRAVAQLWSQAPLGSAMRAMYDLIMVGGLDVNTAWRQVKGEVEGDPGGNMALSLPPDRLDQRGDVQAGTGLFSLYEQASDMSRDMATDPAGVQYDSQTGGYYTESEKPSALAQQFIDMGLPLPTERYEPDMGAVTDFYNREGAGYVPGLAELGAPAGLSADSAALNRAMVALGEREVTSREASPYPQFGDYTAAEPADVRDPNVPFEPPKFSGWDNLPDLTGPVLKPWVGLLEGIAGKLGGFEGGGGDEEPTYPTPLITGEMPKRSRATGRIEDTLAAYAGNRGTPRSYEPITPRTSTVGREVDRERRGLQDQINQGVRDRYKARLAASTDGATGAGIGFGVRKALNEQGRTPFTDAMAQRMMMQQISGF